MPMNKDFKRLVRARMKKTGEAYTTARAHLVRQSGSRAAVSSSRASVATAAVDAAADTPASSTAGASAPMDYAKVAGFSDAAVKKQTGCTWDKWVFALDYAGAHEWSHRAIAEHVQRTYKVRDWWAQMVTVGYERIKGLRAIGQRRSGGFEATKSKSIAAPPATVFRAFADARARRRWLPAAKVVVRKATPHRSVRMTWEDGTSVEIWLTKKGAGKTTAQVQHRKLTSRADADARRRYWTERLEALRVTLES